MSALPLCSTCGQEMELLYQGHYHCAGCVITSWFSEDQVTIADLRGRLETSEARVEALEKLREWDLGRLAEQAALLARCERLVRRLSLALAEVAKAEAGELACLLAPFREGREP